MLSAAPLRLFSPDAAGPAPVVGRHSTLSEFFELWYRPHVAEGQRNNSAATIQLYRDALAWWQRLTNNPPLQAVSPQLLREFAQALQGSVIAHATARKHMATLNRLFTATGRDPYDTGKANLLELAPRLQLPIPEALDIRGHYSQAEIAKLLSACRHMRTPRQLFSPPPSAWWRAYVAVSYLHGLRCGTMLQLEFCHWQFRADGDGWLLIPASLMKGKRKPIHRRLHPQAAAELRNIEAPGRNIIWPWYSKKTSRRYFFRQFRRLCQLAGVEPRGTHGLRRSHASDVARHDPEHARLSLGHSQFQTTASHYIAAEVANPSIQALELPSSEHCQDTTDV